MVTVFNAVHPPETLALECANVTKAFDGHMVVQHASLVTEKGKLLALLGPSTSGKTTTLRMIAGFEWPDKGSISINGRVVAGDRIRIQPEYRRIGMVFQDYVLFPHLDVAANVGFGLSLSTREKQQRVEAMLGMLGLARLARRMPFELSGGEQQRIALARALASNPDVLLLDEPFSNLDTAPRMQLGNEIRVILKDIGMTCVFVTHNQQEAFSLADEVAVMIKGQILQSAPPPEVYQRPATRDVAAFVGEANFVRGEAHGSRVDCVLGSLPLAEASVGVVDVLIRPEQLHFKDAPEARAAAVTWCEFHGHDQRIGLRLEDGTALVARQNTLRQYSVGQAVQVSVARPVHCFPV
jgi:iron(III) transport system ATP-binding protein